MHTYNGFCFDTVVYMKVGACSHLFPKFSAGRVTGRAVFASIAFVKTEQDRGSKL